MNNPKFNNILPETDDRTLCTEIVRPITKEGYAENFLPRIQAMLEKHGEIRFLIYFKDYKGWEEEAAALDMITVLDYGKHVKKYAMVNPPEKIQQLYELKSSLMHGETKIFSSQDLETAIEWVKD